jgi:lipid A ethanolaminephosphotransferase
VQPQAIPAALARWQPGPNQLLVLVALFITTTQNLSFWREATALLPAERDSQEALFLGGLFVAVWAWLVIVLSVFSARFILKPALIVLVLVSAVCSYFMDTFHVVIDEVMVTNVLQTDARETSDLLGLRFFLHFALMGVVPAVLIARVRVRYGRFGRESLRRVVLVVLAFLALIGAVLPNYKTFTLWAREHHHLRMYMNPTHALYSVYRHAEHSLRGPAQHALAVIGEDARLVPADSGRPRVVILVVGEAARAASFQLDGYARPTNPELGRIPGLLNYPRVYSCGTSTAVSLPCMFSPLGRAAFKRSEAASRENLLDVLQRAGVDVLWRDANSGCKGICARVVTENLAATRGNPLCQDGACFDEILLQDLAGRLARRGRSQFVVLHQQGSHGPAYYKRYPEAYRRFLPECAQEDQVQTCPREHIVNTYDNTILYTDHVLAQVIALLKSREAEFDSVMVYASDHGESLGENGIYLHGLPYVLAPDEQKHIPFLVWFSRGAPEAQRLDPACIAARRTEEYSHDNLFDTALGLMGVRTAIYRQDRDMFAPCRGGPPG